jgi:hypothetical protein
MIHGFVHPVTALLWDQNQFWIMEFFPFALSWSWNQFYLFTLISFALMSLKSCLVRIGVLIVGSPLREINEIHGSRFDSKSRLFVSKCWGEVKITAIGLIFQLFFLEYCSDEI